MGRFIIVVLDGFGVGSMADAAVVRPEDVGANTFGSIAKAYPELRLPTLEALGLMNIAGFSLQHMKKAPLATTGTAELAHFGADTFWGHQEIMGTRPKRPAEEPLAPHLDAVKERLANAGYKVEVYPGKAGRMLILNGAATVADNIECDPGLAINVTAAIDDLPFDEVKRIGALVRAEVTASRVIAFGGSGVHLADLLAAVEEKENGYIGVNAPRSGVYRDNYHCVHMGYGVNPETQLPHILAEAGIPSFLLGKAADIIQNPVPENSYSLVPTGEVLAEACRLIASCTTCFVCANVQETDLAGHREDPREYLHILEEADRGIAELLGLLAPEDILVVMADHGNDPGIGHPRHTRERVPLMMHGERVKPGEIGLRRSLSDVAATAAAYFGVRAPENGEDFLREIRG